MDIHLSLNHDLKKFCFFDVKEQALKKRDPSTTEMPDDIAKYFDEKNVFKTEQYFFDFAASVHSIISTLGRPSFKILSKYRLKDFIKIPLRCTWGGVLEI